eukprot:gnl/MRDRNA2_/MRDRNA2_85442_c0_seq1.p2 gnl/MRDRNA2_/MRDRNA2_85442_c0~~gnl/MRDRNA2_/MRDRNA2_85442_c0_seq1.p2  ORF type:complete len:188 (+),score=19.33 gnl/MRDRNA2_/MRDRNA2_85442_c0_seq1:1011-1574(+)
MLGKLTHWVANFQQVFDPVGMANLVWVLGTSLLRHDCSTRRAGRRAGVHAILFNPTGVSVALRPACKSGAAGILMRVRSVSSSAPDMGQCMAQGLSTGAQFRSISNIVGRLVVDAMRVWLPFPAAALEQQNASNISWGVAAPATSEELLPDRTGMQHLLTSVASNTQGVSNTIWPFSNAEMGGGTVT